MRALGRWAMGLVGLVLLLGGAVAATYVGSDDVVMLEEHPVGSARDRLMISGPQLFAYRNLDLVVAARNARGVRVGSVDGIDAADLEASGAHFSIDRMDADGRTSGARQSSGRPDVPDLSSPVWRSISHADGEGTARVVVALDGDRRVLVAPDRVGAPTRLTVGARFDGMFATFAGVALVGLALVAAFLLLGRRRRTRPASEEGAASPRLALAVLAVTAGALLSGCLWIPEEVDPAPSTPRVGLDPEDAPAMLRDYDRRNNAAIRAARPPRYRNRWAAADSGATLLADELNTRLNRALGSKPRGRSIQHRLQWVYSPAFRRYPTWACAAVEPRWSGTGKPLYRRGGVKLGCFVREHAVSPWKLMTSVPMERRDLPGAQPAGRPTTATPADHRRATALTDRLQRAWTGGRSPSGLRWDRDAKVGQYFERRSERRSFIDHAEVSQTSLGVTDGGVEGVDPGPMVMRTKGGLLVVRSAEVTVTEYARGDSGLVWNKGYRRIFGTNVSGALSTPYVVTYVVQVPARGPARVLDWQANLRSP